MTGSVCVDDINRNSLNQLLQISSDSMVQQRDYNSNRDTKSTAYDP